MTASERASGSCVTTMARNVGVVVSFEAPAAAANAGTMGQWGAPFAWPAVAINAALLPNRRVLTYGRHDHVPVLWDPAKPGIFTDLPLPADFFCSGFAFLKGGQLLVAGGHAGVDNFGLKSSYIVHSTTNQWIQGGGHAERALVPHPHDPGQRADVLAISGGDTAAALNVIPEVYLPGNEHVAGADRGGEERAVLSDDVRGAGRQGLQRRDRTRRPPSSTPPAPDPGPPARPASSAGETTAPPSCTTPARSSSWGAATPTATAEVIDLTGARTWSFVGSMATCRAARPTRLCWRTARCW